ncbi:MAG: hypothetical protein K1X70_11850 [Leptospirales bacterium]|nr:hypothetical protein [Leptospirales bacterium]
MKGVPMILIFSGIVTVSGLDAQSIVGRWACVSPAGINSVLVMTADGRLSTESPLGSFSGNYRFDGRNFTYVLSVNGIQTKPVTNVITRLGSAEFESFSVNNPAQKDKCRREPERTSAIDPHGANFQCIKGDCMNGAGSLKNLQNGTIITGTFVGGLPADGTSVRLDFQDGSYFLGTLKPTAEDGAIRAEGRLTGKSGMICEGPVVNWQLQGKIKCDASQATDMVWKTYVGEASNSQFEGQGELVYKSGFVYKGAFLKGVPRGAGRMTLPDGTIIEGSFQSGGVEGKGRILWPTGDRYEGDFRKGSRTGKGILFWKDGSRYVGDWKDDKRHGHGVEYAPDGSIRFQGEFIYDEPGRADP